MTHLIRLANQRDLDFLREYDRHPTERALLSAVEDERVLVLDERGSVQGWLRWSLFWDEHPFLNMIYLLKAHREHGLGTLLLDEWEGAMRAAQHCRVLTSTASDERSQRLYRRRGYIDAGVLLLPGEVAELLLWKDLNPPAFDMPERRRPATRPA